MKTKNTIIALALLAGPFVGAYLYKGYLSQQPPSAQPQPRLEEILSIKELHLVKHTYNDLFFIHRKNSIRKPVRAIVQVPVNVTAFINLKAVKFERRNDTIRSIILPPASLNKAAYEMDRMLVTKMRSFQLHAGKDLYPEVSQYIQQLLDERIDSVQRVAVRNHILEQAEAEGKEYIETVLKAVGRPDIVVTFGSREKDKAIGAFQTQYLIEKKNIADYLKQDTTVYQLTYLATSNIGK